MKRGVWPALLLALVVAQPALAADEALVLRTQAAQLAADGRCAEALPVLAQVRELDPSDPAAPLLEGKCRFNAKQYADAVAPLEEALQLDPNSGDAALTLGMAQYHAGDLDGATASFARASELVPNSPEAALYTGLILLEGEEAGAAVERFDHAAAQRGSLEPAATYYAALARATDGRRAEAEEQLARVQQLAPGSVWAERAQEALDRPPSAHRLRRWLVLSVGVDYDTNVQRLSDSITFFPNISRADDGLVWWAAEVGHEVFRRGRWGGGVIGSYYGNAHFSLPDFDEHQVGGSFWIDYAVSESTLFRLQPGFGQSWFNYNSFRQHYGGLAELLHTWNEKHRGNFYARYHYSDYRFRIPGSQLPPAPTAADIARLTFASRQNRDAHVLRYGYDHYWTLDDKTELRGGPYARNYISNGDEYDHWGVGGWLGIRRALPWQFTLDALGSVTYDDYDSPSVFLQPGESTVDREDVISVVQVALSRPITDRLTGTLRWRFQDNDSNTRVFDYDRHVVGAYLTIAFGD